MVAVPERLLIVADDFAGATDCGAPFAQRGVRTRAVLDAERVVEGDWPVIALDTDSRDAGASQAAERVRRALRCARGTDVIFKKVDSTLRGQIAAELEAVLAGHAGACVVAAPAFPATGRTTREGRQLVHGQPLELSEFGDHVSSSRVADHLGLPASGVGLEQIRRGELADEIRRVCAKGGGAVVCDAESEDDLGEIAHSGMRNGGHVLWLGSAGLARALAAFHASGATAVAAPPGRRDLPLLLVIGSPAAATIAQLRRLAEARDCHQVTLKSDPPDGNEGLELRLEEVVRALRTGEDCALTLDGEDGSRDAGRMGSRQLAAIAARAAEHAAGLVLTGGETARAVLEAMSIRGLDLAGEIQAGIALGWTDGPRPLAVAVKAGGFGDPDALLECRRAMRRRHEEAAA